MLALALKVIFVASMVAARTRMSRPLHLSDDEVNGFASNKDLVARSGFFGLNNQISQDDRREESRLTGKKIERLSELLVDTREVDVDAVLQEAEERDPAGYTCMNKVMLIKEVEHEEEVHCRHVSHEICHVSPKTTYETKTIETCTENFVKECFLSTEDEAHVEKVRICRKKPTRDCDADQENVEDVCETLQETICETTYKSIDVVEDKVQCRVVLETACQKDEDGNIMEDMCMKTPKKKCETTAVTNSKLFPKTACRQEPYEVCGKPLCPINFDNEICEDREKTFVNKKPRERCDIKPRQVCHDEAVYYPRLENVKNCYPVEREVCALERVNPKEVERPIIKKWCTKDNVTNVFNQGFGKMLLIGGNPSSRVDLLDLETGDICPFAPIATTINDGEGTYINGRAIACGQNACITCNGTQWTSDGGVMTGPNPSNFNEEAAIRIGNSWVVTQSQNTTHTATYVFKENEDDENNNWSWSQGPVLEVGLGNGYCLTMTSATTAGMISSTDGGMYIYNITADTVTRVGTSPYYDGEGSCQTLIHNGVPVVVYFPGLDGNNAQLKGKVLLWNTVTNEITPGQDFPVDPDRDDAQAFAWNDNTIIFGGGENPDPNMYYYTIDGGFQAFGTHGFDTMRENFVMINVPNDFQCLQN